MFDRLMLYLFPELAVLWMLHTAPADATYLSAMVSLLVLLVTVTAVYAMRHQLTPPAIRAHVMPVVLPVGSLILSGFLLGYMGVLVLLSSFTVPGPAWYEYALLCLSVTNAVESVIVVQRAVEAYLTREDVLR